MSRHHARCIDNAIQAIADNNAASLAAGVAEGNLTSETESEGLEWLANGNTSCWMEGDYCQV